MASIEIRGVDKSFGATQVLHDVDLQVADGEFLVLVGPSGCGKSTLLRLIAGLEEVSAGEIVIGGRVVNDLPPKDRDIAMVFQNYALYPHMTVSENMAFSLRMRREAKAAAAKKVADAAETLDLAAFLDRYPRQLSGGQRQRVAMGRAIVRDPQVFLFDEPLSNLDAKLRVQMRVEIKSLHQRIHATSIYVTHDQIEAMTMADRIVVLQKGRVEQVGTPLELYDHPANLFVAGFIGSPAMNFIRGRLHRHDGAFGIEANDGTRLAERRRSRRTGRPGRRLQLPPRAPHARCQPATVSRRISWSSSRPARARTSIATRAVRRSAQSSASGSHSSRARRSGFSQRSSSSTCSTRQPERSCTELDTHMFDNWRNQMKKWSTKRALSSFVTAAMLTLMAGGTGLAADTPAGFPKDNVTIEIWWHEYGPFTAYMKELIEAYKKVRPNVTVNPVITSSGDINQKLTVALATGTGPDIMDQDASFYELYYAKGVLEPLNLEVFGAKSYDELTARYTPGGIAAGTFGGKVYALPYQGNSMSLFINNKAFAAAGLDPVKDAPKTWDDMKALGPKLKKVQGTRTVQKAFDFPYHSPRWEVQMFQPLVEQFGGKLLSDDGKTVYLNSPEAVKALTLWRDVTKVTGDPKTTLNTPSNPNQDFIDGRTAMWVTGPWATSQIRAVGDQGWLHRRVVSPGQSGQAAHDGVWLDVGGEQGEAGGAESGCMGLHPFRAVEAGRVAGQGRVRAAGQGCERDRRGQELPVLRRAHEGCRHGVVVYPLRVHQRDRPGHRPRDRTHRVRRRRSEDLARSGASRNRQDPEALAEQGRGREPRVRRGSRPSPARWPRNRPR